MPRYHEEIRYFKVARNTDEGYYQLVANVVMRRIKENGEPDKRYKTRQLEVTSYAHPDQNMERDVDECVTVARGKLEDSKWELIGITNRYYIRWLYGDNPNA